MAGEGGFQLGRDARAQLACFLVADLLQEGRQQEATHAPRHSVGCAEDGGLEAEAAVDVDLLVGGRAVAAVGARPGVQHDFHRRQDLTGELAAADGVEGERGAGGAKGGDQVFHEGRLCGVDDVRRADVFQDLRLLVGADDVDQTDAVLEADAVQHLAEVGGGGRVDEGGVALHLHRLDHGERGQRVDEAGGAVGGAGACGQRQGCLGFHGAVGGVHFTAENGDELAHQGLSFGRGAGGDDRAGAFIADGQVLVEPGGDHAQGLIRHGGRDDGQLLRAGDLERGDVGGTDEQAEVGRVDRRAFDADHDFVRGQVSDGELHQREFEFAGFADLRAKLDVLERHAGFSQLVICGIVSMGHP